MILVATVATGGGVLFQTGVLFSTETRNFAIFWPILAILSQIYAQFSVLFTGGGVSKLTNIRYESMMSVVMRV